MLTKKTSIFFIFFIAILGTLLFLLKYSVISIEDRIKVAKKELIKETRDRHILKAEWKELTTPERIQRLATKYLKMKQIDPKQIREYDASLFHGDRKKYKNTRGLSKLVNEILAQDNDD